jgi:hypothetical protein
MCPEKHNFLVIAERVLCRHQQQVSITVGPGTVAVCFPYRPTSNNHRDFLLHGLPTLLEYVPLSVRARIWYTHDGAPAHFSRAVRDVLNNAYHVRWIGRGEPTAWPPRSPHLNPLHFYPWGRLKTLVYEYAAPLDNEEALQHRVADACQTIRNCPGISERM